MKIAVNTRLLLANRLEGIGTFANETLARITKANPAIEFHFFFDRPFDPQFIYGKNIVPHVIFPPTRHPLLVEYWMNYAVPKKLKKINASAFVSPDSILFTSKQKTPSHLVIHDINFFHRPLDLPKKHRNFYLKNTPKFIQAATQIATVSQYSKMDLMTSYQVAESKVDVVYNAAKSCFLPLSEEEKKAIQNKYAKGSNYFVYVGSLHPRKNLLNLVKAFDLFKTSSISDVKLLIVGSVLFDDPAFSDVLSNCTHRNEIVFAGRKSDEELSKILASAMALTYVPHFEGFGIPIVEAFACETPVITSNTTCMPEIAGDAALLADPNNVQDISEAMIKLWSNGDFRTQLIQKGIEQNKKYSWDLTADLFWKSIEKIL